MKKSLLLATLLAAALVACGKKEEAKPAAKAEPLKVAFVYVGPVGDGGLPAAGATVIGYALSQAPPV